VLRLVLGVHGARHLRCGDADDAWRNRIAVASIDDALLEPVVWWDTANYFRMSLRPGWHPGDLWDFAYARTLPRYPTYTQDVLNLDPHDRRG
jgi:hypothetical protein